MKSLLLAISLLLSAPVMASGTSIMLGAWSHHLDDGEYNEVHNMIAIEHKGWIGGYFKNSYDDDSFFAGKMINVKQWEHVEAGFTVGVVTGYDLDFMSVGNVMFMFSVYITPRSFFAPTLINLGTAVAAVPRFRF